MHFIGKLAEVVGAGETLVPTTLPRQDASGQWGSLGLVHTANRGVWVCSHLHPVSESALLCAETAIKDIDDQIENFHHNPASAYWPAVLGTAGLVSSPALDTKATAIIAAGWAWSLKLWQPKGKSIARWYCKPAQVGRYQPLLDFGEPWVQFNPDTLLVRTSGWSSSKRPVVDQDERQNKVLDSLRVALRDAGHIKIIGSDPGPQTAALRERLEERGSAPTVRRSRKDLGYRLRFERTDRGVLYEVLDPDKAVVARSRRKSAVLEYLREEVDTDG